MCLDIMIFKIISYTAPLANTSVLVTYTVISVDNELLIASTGCAGQASSLTLYSGWSKITVTI